MRSCGDVLMKFEMHKVSGAGRSAMTAWHGPESAEFSRGSCCEQHVDGIEEINTL